MFGITNAIQLYAKLVQEFDDFCDDPGSGRHAMNFVITAYHLAEWVWKDFLRDDNAKRQELGIADMKGFSAWIAGKSIWAAQMGDLANGSKHFQEKGLPIRRHVVGSFNTAAFNELAFNEMRVTLLVEMGEHHGRPHFVRATHLFEPVMKFWRDFLRDHGPYGGVVPVGRTKLSD